MSRSRGRAIGTGIGWAVLAGASAITGAVCAAGFKFATQVVTPARRPESRVRVHALVPAPESPTGTRVWLSGPDTGLEGSYSFIFDVGTRLTQHQAGHARLGPVVETAQVGHRKRVARDVLSVESGDLRVGSQGRITGWWYTGPEQLPYESRTVSIPLPGGVGWGWLILPNEQRSNRWAVHVHGRGALPQETLRGVEPFLEAGITCLVIAYRNDRGAPAGLRGRYGLGLAELEDVDAAVGWALSQGASRVSLVGWSMGGTTSVLAAARGRHASAIDALVLDSPALDWVQLLRHQAALAGVPRLLASVGMVMLRSGIVRGAVPFVSGTDLGSLTARRLARAIRVPTLIHASPDDTFVPWEGSLRVAQLRSSLVTLHPSRGEHVKLWNVDPGGWRSETRRFISRTDGY